MTAANGNEQNDSMQASYIFSLYLCLPRKNMWDQKLLKPLEILWSVRSYLHSNLKVK
jgi:hypothetical protein